MRLLNSVAVALGLTAALLAAACNPQDASTPPQSQQAVNKSSQQAGPGAPSAPPPAAAVEPADKVRRVTVQELKAALDKGEALPLDVRSESAFQVSHIKGSKLMLESEFDKRLSELPKDKLIVAYCA